MTTIFKVLCGLLLVAVFAGAGVWGTRQLMSEESGEGEGSERQQATRVGVVAPEERQVEDDVSGVGTLRAIRTVELTPAASGRVIEVRVASGDTVSEGDVLVRLDDRAARAALAEAEATLTERRSDFQRFEELGDSDTAADARVEQSRAAFLRAEAAVSTARAELEDRTVTAPFDGTVGLVDLEPGTFLAADEAIARLFDLTSVEILMSLPERYFQSVSPGLVVEMETPAFPGETFEGTVAVKAPQIELETRSFDIRARIDNSDGRLVGGMFANARLVLDSYEALAIPDDAIISEGLSTFVYTVADDTASRTEIVAGTSVGNLTEVREGLDPDARVVVAGWQDLTDGARVEIDEEIDREALN